MFAEASIEIRAMKNLTLRDYLSMIKLETIKEFENGIWRVPKDNKPSFWDKLYSIKITYREDNIYERIEKAMKHLSTFCQKNKEVF